MANERSERTGVKVSIRTLGCPKNSVDSEGLAGMLQAGGHEVSQDPDGADVVLVNTCGFIDPARRETIEEVLDLAELKESSDLNGLILTGCLVARSAGTGTERRDYADEDESKHAARHGGQPFPRALGAASATAAGWMSSSPYPVLKRGC
jgi:tRNA A37 methylthiotransferase MiaB